MFIIAIFSGEFFYPNYKRVESITTLVSSIQQGFSILKNIKKMDILELYNKYSEILRTSPEVNNIEGVIFLSNWLRKSNLLKIIEKNLKDINYLENFIGDKKRIKAQPRGIAVHWIAGNVPTLGMFSLFQSLLVGNANILRVPPKSHEILVKLLKAFSNTKINSGLSGADLLKSIALLYCDEVDTMSNKEISELADIRIVWGGETAVRAITGLPKKSHCIDVIFGPKYSLSVFDNKAIKSEKYLRYIRFLVNEIILFDQTACTSPHTIFFEKSAKPIIEISQDIANEFKRIVEKYPKVNLDPYIATKIINIRGEYALDLNKSVICSWNNDWTILINNEIKLEEPIESRTIFIKEVDSIMDVIPLLTRKIQTIGCAVEDKDKLIEFADQATFRGISRCVSLGQMHLFDSPWDGILLMSAIVNWVTLYLENN